MYKRIYIRRTILLLFIAVALLTTNRTVHAEDNFDAFSYGMKFGYTFGKEGGFTWGFEVSAIKYLETGYQGGVIDLDFCQDDIKLHAGYEIQPSLILPGVCIGPSLRLHRGRFDPGFSIIPYYGVIAIPYYNYSYFPLSTKSISEIGTYIKVPITKNDFFNT